MTLAALMLAPRIFRREVPEAAKYGALGVLFVNVSIGGTLTSFAAPPVLMVAATWNWDSVFMLKQFGWKAAIAVLLNATVAVFFLRRHLVDEAAPVRGVEGRLPVHPALVAVHFAFLAGVILLAHHPVAFLGIFLLFLGVAQAYARHQDPPILREALLVAFFLAGLVVLGGLQRWWLQDVLSRLDESTLFYGAAALTAITDNAALTYLGSLVEGVSDDYKYALVAGAAKGKMPVIELKALADEQFILVRRHGAPGMYSDLIEACEQAGFTLKIASEVERMLTNISLVAAGAGVSVVPASMKDFHRESVVYCRIRNARPALIAPITLVSRDGSNSPAEKNFMDLAKKLARQYKAEG